MHAVYPQKKAQVFLHVALMTDEDSKQAVLLALQNFDDRASIRIDLLTRRVEIDPAYGEPQDFRQALDNAGYASIRQWPSERAYL